MKDHIWEHNNRYRLIKVDGQQDQYDLIPVPGTVYEVGTPINKATILQDSTYTKYKNAAKSGALPSVDNGTPNDVFNALTNAYANGITIIMGQSLTVGYGGVENEGFAKWASIPYDATGKCTLDTTFDNVNYCTKLYVPKGIKKVQISGGFRYARHTQYYAEVKAVIYKNGASVQSMYIHDMNASYYHFCSTNNVITTSGNGSEYIQIFLEGENSGGTFPTKTDIQCTWLVVRMLDF